MNDETAELRQEDTHGELLSLGRRGLLGEVATPTDWRSLGSGESAEAWRGLRAWVVWVRHEFALDHHVVPPCWYRHRALVNVLSALRDHWVSAYDPLSSPAGPASWHLEFLQLEQGVRDWASRTGCAIGVHRPDVVAEFPDDTEEWDAHIAADKAARERAEARSQSAGGGDRD